MECDTRAAGGGGGVGRTREARPRREVGGGPTIRDDTTMIRRKFCSRAAKQQAARAAREARARAREGKGRRKLAQARRLLVMLPMRGVAW